MLLLYAEQKTTTTLYCSSWLVKQSVVVYLLKFFLLNFQHCLDPPHDLPKWLALWRGVKQKQNMKLDNLALRKSDEKLCYTCNTPPTHTHTCLILSKKGIPKVPKTSLWKWATGISISLSLSKSTWSKGISWMSKDKRQIKGKKI